MVTDIFFDLDGVIIDSRSSIAASVDATLRAAGLPPLEPHEVASLVGPPIVEGLMELLRNRGRDVAGAPALVAVFREIYERIAETETTVVPGIADVIEELAAGHRLAVATSKARYLAVPILESFGLASWFRVIVGPAREALYEPKTQTLARAVVLTEAGPHRVMIGDRLHDIVAGKANGCRTVGVTWGIGSRTELVDTGADIIVDKVSELAAAIDP